MIAGLLVGVEAGSEVLGSCEISKKQLAAAARAAHRALLSQKKDKTSNHVGMEARKIVVVAYFDFNKLGQHKM